METFARFLFKCQTHCIGTRTIYASRASINMQRVTPIVLSLKIAYSLYPSNGLYIMWTLYQPIYIGNKNQACIVYYKFAIDSQSGWM